MKRARNTSSPLGYIDIVILQVGCLTRGWSMSGTPSKIKSEWGEMQYRSAVRVPCACGMVITPVVIWGENNLELIWLVPVGYLSQLQLKYSFNDTESRQDTNKMLVSVRNVNHSRTYEARSFCLYIEQWFQEAIPILQRSYTPKWWVVLNLNLVHFPWANWLTLLQWANFWSPRPITS